MKMAKVLFKNLGLAMKEAYTDERGNWLNN